MIRVAILGSTGSIGCSALEVIARHPERFRVVGLTAHRSADALADQVARFQPEVAILADPHCSLPPSGSVSWREGRDALLELVASDDVDVVINALVGAAGLEPTLRALEAGKRLALANKESLVAGGPLVLEAEARGGGQLIPIDSEHSAILQCLEGTPPESVKRIVLTASGGPFRGWSAEDLERVAPSDALRHPTWSMGSKITVDSATLANKALEVIEAHFLYGIPYERIDVVVHPQSIVHSFVETVDGSVMAQLGFPTMELPILYALCYPERVTDPVLQTFNPVAASPLTFEVVDEESFRLFGLGVGAGKRGGTAPAVFNAANEVAVEAFLSEEIGFTEMARVVREVLDAVPHGPANDVEEILRVDGQARAAAHETVVGARIMNSQGLL